MRNPSNDLGYQTPPIVLDTNVLVAGACRHEASRAYQILLAVLEARIPLILTPAIVLEYQDVLLRPRILTLTGLTHKQSVDLVTDLVHLSHKVQQDFQWRPNLSDEADNKFVEAAVHTAAVVVTYNVAHFQAADLTPHGWTVMTPDKFLMYYPI